MLKIILFYIANPEKKRNKVPNTHLATAKTSQRDNFYPPTHLKRHFDVLRGNLNMDAAPKAEQKQIQKKIPCFVFVNLREKFILCYFAYAYVVREDRLKLA